MTTASRSATAPGIHGTAGGELRGLTGLRALAALWVVLFHFHFTPLPGVAEVVGVLGPLVTAGALGVDLFFVLSGFVIAHTYLDELGPALRARVTARFVWARIARLWPVYALVLHLFGGWLLFRSVTGTGGEIAFQAVQPVLDVGQYVQQLFLVQLWDDPYLDGASWVGPTWSVSAEWLAYLLFPVIALVLFRLRRLPAVALASGAVLLMVPMAWAYLGAGSPYFPWSWALRILCGFAAGALAHLVVRSLRSTPAVRWCASALAAVLPVAIATGLLLGELAGPGRGGAVILLFPLLVAALAVADRGPATVLSTSVPVYGGRLSYGLYLVHIPLFEVYWWTMERHSWLASHTVLAHVVGVLVVAAAVVLAALAYHLVEEPSRRSLRAIGPGLGRFAVRVLTALGLVRSRSAAPASAPAAGTTAGTTAGSAADDALATAVDRFAATRRAQASGRPDGSPRPDWFRPDGFWPETGHAASPARPATLAAAFVTAQERPAPHHPQDVRAGFERAEYIRRCYLRAGM